MTPFVLATAIACGPAETPSASFSPSADGGNGGSNSCPVLEFPSGVRFQSVPDEELTRSYEAIADEENYVRPVCFLDTSALVDLATGAGSDLDVLLSPHFRLREFVENAVRYNPRVLLSPSLVEKLERFRSAMGDRPVVLSSGYRSPAHQRAVCRDMCGADSCPGRCATRSRHSWGDAIDVGVLPKNEHAAAACNAEFRYVFLEGDHLHLDLNPQHEPCTVDIL